jgi:hypothetical protein
MTITMLDSPLLSKQFFGYGPNMGSPSDVVTITLPRSIVPELPTFAHALNDRMHDLLERNTEGTLSESERAELESLVQMAQFAQILTMATQQRPG